MRSIPTLAEVVVPSSTRCNGLMLGFPAEQAAHIPQPVAALCSQCLLCASSQVFENVHLMVHGQMTWCASSQVFDIETGFDTTLLNLNPAGWIEGVTTERSWKMLYGMDVCTQRQVTPPQCRLERPACVPGGAQIS